MLVGRPPRESRPVRLRTLMLRRGLVGPPAWVIPAAASSESRCCFRRRRRRKARMRRRARARRVPMTTPAIAPGERWLRWRDWRSAALDGAGKGVEVTVCVTIAPERVTTRRLVTGVADCGGGVLEVWVMAGTGATTGGLVLLEVDKAEDVDRSDDVVVRDDGGSELEDEDGDDAEVDVCRKKVVSVHSWRGRASSQQVCR